MWFQGKLEYETAVFVLVGVTLHTHRHTHTHTHTYLIRNIQSRSSICIKPRGEADFCVKGESNAGITRKMVLISCLSQNPPASCAFSLLRWNIGAQGRQLSLKPVKTSARGTEICARLPNVPFLQTYLALFDFLLLLQPSIGGNVSTLINQILNYNATGDLPSI